MRILVTGVAGFIGSHLCEKLLSEGNEIIFMDNFFTGNKINVKPSQKFKFFHVINHDITKPIDLSVDQIFNLACPTSPKYYQEDIVFIDLPLDDPLKRKPDIEKAKKLLKWEPQIFRKDGLLKTYEYYQKLIEHSN